MVAPLDLLRRFISLQFARGNNAEKRFVRETMFATSFGVVHLSSPWTKVFQGST